MDLLICLTWELLGKIHRSILLRETFFARLGGGGGGAVTQERFSNFSTNRFFFKQRNYRKNLVSKEEHYRQHNFKPNKLFKLEQIWRRPLHSRLPIGTIRINCSPTPRPYFTCHIHQRAHRF